MSDEDLQTTTSAKSPADTLGVLASALQSLNQSDPEAQALARRFTALFVVDAGGLDTLGTGSQDEQAMVERIVDALGEPGKAFRQIEALPGHPITITPKAA